MELTFWLLIFLIVYTYFGYPLILLLLASFSRERVKKKYHYPYVSIIIAAHNEEKGIKNKLTNTTALDYPSDRLEIIVASDCSSDSTNEIVKNFKFDKLRLIEFKERYGKTHVQNEAIKEANGEIILFSDATTIYDTQVLKKITRNFADPQVGAVGGELVFLNKSSGAVGEGDGLYWKYEKLLKKKESQVSSLIGVSGCCYAVRKELYEPIEPDLISDFVIAQMVYKKGKRVVYEPQAISYEETCGSAKEEFHMRVRIAVRTLYGMWNMKEILNPLKYGFFAIQLISHKVLRYLVPLFLVLLFLINGLLIFFNASWLYRIIFLLQLVFYLTVVLGWMLRNRKTYLSIPFYFYLTNFALLTGLWQFLRGERKVLWNPSRK